MPTEDELIAVLKAESSRSGRRARLGYSDKTARIVAQRVLLHSALSVAAADYVLTPEDIAGLCLHEYKQDQAVGFLGFGTISLWFAQAFISWAVQRLLRYLSERNRS